MEPVRQIVKRPNETIGIVPNGKQRITLLVRRLYSVILLFSQQQGEREEYSAALADMLAVAHSAGSNRAQVKELLRDIRAIGVDWNVREGEREVWKNVGLIEEPGLIDGRGTPTIVTWKLPKLIRARLLDPRGFFTRISLEMMTRLRSGASIALYEICCQYVSNDHGKGEGGLTNRAPIAEWMPRLTGSRKTVYEYKFLKRDVLLAAIEEINEITDLRVELVEHKIGRRVGELQFRVFKKDIVDSTRGAAAQADNLRYAVRAVDGEFGTVAQTTTAGINDDDLSPTLMPQGASTRKKPAAKPLVPSGVRRSPGAARESVSDSATVQPVPAAVVVPVPKVTAPALPAAPDTSPLPIDPEDAPFLQRMLDIGAPLPTARRLLARYVPDMAYLARHLDFVEQRIRSGTGAPLINTVAFLQKALDHGYAEAARPVSVALAATVKRAARAVPAAAKPPLEPEPEAATLSVDDGETVAQTQATLLQRAEVWARFQGLPQDAAKARLVEAFLEQTGATLKTFYRKNGVNNMIVKASLTDWLIREKNF